MSLLASLKRHLPFRYQLKSAVAHLQTWPERKKMALAPLDAVRVSYGQKHVPTRNEIAYGGMVKFQWMQELYRNDSAYFNILYMVSSQPPLGAEHIAKTAKKIGAKLAWNQNGVAYPGWYGWPWKERNQRMAKVLHMADHVFYQSHFCRMAADEFLGVCKTQSEVLYNPIDTETFTPPHTPSEGLILLLAGNQYQYYRLENAIKTLAIVRKQHPDARLIVTGKLNWLPNPKETARIAEQLIHQQGVSNAVTFLGPYQQSEAPDIFRNAHILLHTRYNDPCPTVVLEALSAGLPVVYSNSGGTPELVGPDAGIGIETELNWEQEHPPTPEALAEAVLKVASNHTGYAQKARERAVTHFDLRPWLQRHKEVFQKLLHT